MSRRFWVAAGMGAALAGTAVCLAKESVKVKQDDLKKIQTEIDEKQKEKKSASRRARELREEVERISNELQSARKALARVESRYFKAEKKRAEAEARLMASQHDLIEWRNRLSSSIQGYYMRWTVGREGTLPALAYEQALLKDRATGLAFAIENHQSVQSFRDDLAQAEENLGQIRLDQQREEHRIEVARAHMEELQKTAEGRRLVLDRQIKELNASARRFEKKIAELIAKERAAQARAQKLEKATPIVSVPRGAGRKWEGKLPWPVKGTVVQKFGRSVNADLGAPTISNGVTLRTEADTPVKAVQGGEVLYAGPFMNYGLMALVSHPDRLHTIYAHLGGLRVTRGQQILAGDTVGDPGRDDNGRPTVYFEIRMDGEPVNPEAWLQ